MKTAVRYYSRSGNTKIIAEAIGKALNVPAETTDVPLSGPVDLLFLGGALYAGEPNERIKTFIEALTPETVKNVAVFSTAMGDVTVHSRIQALLAEKNISLVDATFHTKGSFLFFNRKLPNEHDCARAADFALEQAAKL